MVPVPVTLGNAGTWPHSTEIQGREGGCEWSRDCELSSLVWNLTGRVAFPIELDQLKGVAVEFVSACRLTRVIVRFGRSPTGPVFFNGCGASEL